MDHLFAHQWNQETALAVVGSTAIAVALGVIFKSKLSGVKMLEEAELVYLKPCVGETFEEKLVTINGGQRNVASWLPSKGSPKAVAIVVHGLHEHALNYYAVAHELTAKGYAVYGMDHHGHGKSGTEMGMVRSFELLVEDLVAFVESIRKRHPNLPIFMCAHSMGTLVTILSATMLPFVKAIVFSACPLVSGPGASSLFGIKALYPITQTRLAVIVTKYLSQLDPRGPAAPILMEELTSDPEELEAAKRDPRRFHKSVMNKTGYEFLKMVDATKAALPRFTTPFLALHGKEDTCAYPSGSGILYEKSGTLANEKKKILLEGLKHEIFHERKPYGPQAIQAAVAYFEEQLSKK